MASAPRAIKNKPPNCILTEFAEAGMKFSLTFWIADPDGLDNVKSEVMLALWDAFKREGIRVPYGPRNPHPRRALPVEQVVEVSGQKQVFLEPPAPQPRLAAARSNH